MNGTEHKPEGELEITEGEAVMFKDSGVLLGHVRDVVYDDGELVGVVIKPAGLFTHDVLIQVRFLDRSDDLVLFAHISKDDVQHLAPYTGTE